MSEAERFVVDGLTVRIMYDENAQSPREDDNFGHMVCFHREYTLGDKHEMSVDEAKSFADKVLKNGGIVLPLYLYDHSGITMSVNSFSCSWDSGQVGFIYATKEDIRKNWNLRKVTKEKLEDARKLLIAEVEYYDDYLTGQSYGYIVESPEGDHLDSCWGFVGDKYVKEAATESAKHEAQKYGAAHNG
jgi:hypothetical protein